MYKDASLPVRVSAAEDSPTRGLAGCPLHVTLLAEAMPRRAFIQENAKYAMNLDI